MFKNRLKCPKIARYLLISLAAAVLCSCGKSQKLQSTASADQWRPGQEAPIHIRGTIAEFAQYQSAGPLPVQGDSLVVGLGTNGSREVPSSIREYLLKQVAIVFPDAQPSLVLRDMDTAVVTLFGAMPFGAPIGTKFDVFVRSAPQTGTRSLSGGALITTELRATVFGAGGVSGPTKTISEADGQIFVNPFIDVDNVNDLVKARQGRIIAGGRVVAQRPIRLVLIEPDYARAMRIRQRINERFPSRVPVADAKNKATIELDIPLEYIYDYQHYLRLVLHLPLRMGVGVWEAHARRLVDELESPEAKHEDLALVLEAMGRAVVPTLRTKYASPNAQAAYYAARVGLRFQENVAAEVIIGFALGEDRQLQLKAIDELGRHGGLKAAAPALQKLMDSSNEIIRAAAYESMLKRPKRRNIARTIVGKPVENFKLDMIRSTRSDNVIYATATGEARIAVFGRDVRVADNVFFEAPGKLVTINANAGDKKLTVVRKTPRTGRLSPPFECDFDVRSLIRVLGRSPRPDAISRDIQGLGLTYSQTLSVLYKMCEEGHINAKFVLQKPPAVGKIYRRNVGRVGRPDKPGQ